MLICTKRAKISRTLQSKGDSNRAADAGSRPEFLSLGNVVARTRGVLVFVTFEMHSGWVIEHGRERLKMTD